MNIIVVLRLTKCACYQPVYQWHFPLARKEGERFLLWMDIEADFDGVDEQSVLINDSNKFVEVFVSF